jgi:hypothetical protein
MALDRFKIVCNEINNPASVVQENKLVADVYVQPVFAAETNTNNNHKHNRITNIY